MSAVGLGRALLVGGEPGRYGRAGGYRRGGVRLGRRGVLAGGGAARSRGGQVGPARVAGGAGSRARGAGSGWSGACREWRRSEPRVMSGLLVPTDDAVPLALCPVEDSATAISDLLGGVLLDDPRVVPLGGRRDPGLPADPGVAVPDRRATRPTRAGPAHPRRSRPVRRATHRLRHPALRSRRGGRAAAPGRPGTRRRARPRPGPQRVVLPATTHRGVPAGHRAEDRRRGVLGGRPGHSVPRSAPGPRPCHRPACRGRRRGPAPLPQTRAGGGVAATRLPHQPARPPTR